MALFSVHERGEDSVNDMLGIFLAFTGRRGSTVKSDLQPPRHPMWFSYLAPLGDRLEKRWNLCC